MRRSLTAHLWRTASRGRSRSASRRGLPAGTSEYLSGDAGTALIPPPAIGAGWEAEGASFLTCSTAPSPQIMPESTEFRERECRPAGAHMHSGVCGARERRRGDSCNAAACAGGGLGCARGCVPILLQVTQPLEHDTARVSTRKRARIAPPARTRTRVGGLQLRGGDAWQAAPCALGRARGGMGFSIDLFQPLGHGGSGLQRARASRSRGSPHRMRRGALRTQRSQRVLGEHSASPLRERRKRCQSRACSRWSVHGCAHTSPGERGRSSVGSRRSRRRRQQ